MQLKNYERHGFRAEPVREGHAHVCFEKPIEETISNYADILRHFNCSTANLCAIPASHSITENWQTAYCKARFAPRIFASAGPEYFLDERDNADNLLLQAKEYHEMGFDGIKMLDGKVTQYRITKYSLAEKRFDKLFAYAEQNEIPIVMHIGDPAKFWDKSQMTEYAISRGWVYEPYEPSLEDVRGWVFDILARYPGLHLVLAHFFFMGGELDRAAKIFDTYKNVCFDLTPGGEMFVKFTENYDESRAFFEKYSDRLLYGTDMYNTFESAEKAEAEVTGPRVYQLRSMLEGKEEFMSTLISDKPIRPFGFEGEILDKIYTKNAERLYGKTPRALDMERIGARCRRFMEERSLSPLEMQNMKIITEYFERG